MKMAEENNYLVDLEVVLKKLLSNNPTIRIATISSIEGLPILSLSLREFDETMISAIVAALLSLSEKAIIETKIGELKQLYIRGIDGYLLVFEADSAVLAVSTTDKANLGLIFLECEHASLKISKILK